MKGRTKNMKYKNVASIISKSSPKIQRFVADFIVCI